MKLRNGEHLLWMRLLAIISIGLILVNNCKKEEGKIEQSQVSVMARDTLYYVMKEFYYWYDKPECKSVTESNKGIYKDPYELLEAMRYRAVDRWSFVADYDEFIGQMQGNFVGHGIRISLDTAGKVRIVIIYNKSPLYLEGVRRGWIIEKINNIDPAPILNSGDNNAWTNLIGQPVAGVSNTFLFQRPDGSEVTISSTKTAFTINTVLLSEVIDLNSVPTGHLVFDQFIEPTQQELVNAFSAFKNAEIKDLILDLKYNTGGYISIAQTLASYIAGNSKNGNTFVRLTYNNKHQEQNFAFNYENTQYGLDLSRIMIITTRSTASASEALINGLRPFVTEVLIGDTTNGKPCGMNGWPILNKYYAWPVTFEMANAQGVGNYYFGFTPDKVMLDDITRDFSDPEEMCFKEAIHYLEAGSFLTKGVQTFKRYPQYSEKPEWMNNAFINEKQKTRDL